MTKKKYEAGLIPEVEALTMEVDLAEARNGLTSSQAAMESSKRAFTQLIGLNVTDDVGVNVVLQVKEIKVDVEKAIRHGLENRSEIRESEINVELAKINVDQVNARSHIEGNLWAFYDLTGVSDPYLDYDSSPYRLWRSSIEDLQRRPNNRGVGFTLSLPLWDSGVNGAEVASSEADLRDQEHKIA